MTADEIDDIVAGPQEPDVHYNMGRSMCPVCHSHGFVFSCEGKWACAVCSTERYNIPMQKRAELVVLFERTVIGDTVSVTR